MQRLGWSAYNKSSYSYFEQYNSLKFSKVHRSFSRFLPKVGSHVLDVGAGAGRDAHSMAQRGYFVTAVEPSVGLLNLAQKVNGHKNIIWVRDSLPLLKKLTRDGPKFDFILLSAVWMHIRPKKRMQALRVLNNLLNENGHLAITLRIGQEIPERHIYEVDVEGLLDLASELNFKKVYVSRLIKDSLSRENVTWRKVVLAKDVL
jgi:2-polyprenyl-3-methyl-5-hydroxy-6-metoxy-1,4-benzoquinol methylase